MKGCRECRPYRLLTDYGPARRWRLCLAASRRRPSSRIRRAVAGIVATLFGGSRGGDLAVHLCGTRFQIKVFSPTPPALSEIRKTSPRPAWKASTRYADTRRHCLKIESLSLNMQVWSLSRARPIFASSRACCGRIRWSRYSVRARSGRRPLPASSCVAVKLARTDAPRDPRPDPPVATGTPRAGAAASRPRTPGPGTRPCPWDRR